MIMRSRGNDRDRANSRMTQTHGLLRQDIAFEVRGILHGWPTGWTSRWTNTWIIVLPRRCVVYASSTHESVAALSRSVEIVQNSAESTCYTETGREEQSTLESPLPSFVREEGTNNVRSVCCRSYSYFPAFL